VKRALGAMPPRPGARRPATSVVLAAAAIAVAAACGGADDRRPVLDSARAAPDERAPAPAAPGAAPYHAEELRDVTGDGRPERVTIDAAGPRDDSLAVRLTIRSAAGDTLLYADEWRSAEYFKYLGPPASLPADSVSRVVRQRLGALLADSAFGRVPAAGPPKAPGSVTDAVLYDLAAHQVRAARGIAPTAPLPADANDAVERAARVPALGERAATLARELRGRPMFTYHAGGEATHGVAWSATERRVVKVLSCC